MDSLSLPVFCQIQQYINQRSLMSFLVTFIFLMKLCPASYSSEFVARYGESTDNNDYVYLVIPRENGFVFVENSMFRLFEYSVHSQQFESYQDFLYQVLNDKSYVLYEQWKPQRIRDYSQLDKKRQDKLLNNYLYCDEENRYRFKRRLPDRKLYGIIKLMFDRGYFVGKMDYQAYWFFYDCLAPKMEGIPPEK